jgi:hypothetical protein
MITSARDDYLGHPMHYLGQSMHYLGQSMHQCQEPVN